MSTLPAWLQQVRETLPGWVEAVRYDGEGHGRYRFAIDAYEPYDLDSSRMLESVVLITGGGLDALTEQQRGEWIAYLRDLQRPEDGLMIDPGMERHILSAGPEPTAEEVAKVRGFTTRNGLCTILDLKGTPKYPMKNEIAVDSPDGMRAYLDGLHWHNPWGAGSWAGLGLVFQHINRVCGDERAGDIIQAGVDWLHAHQDPETGGWPRGSQAAPHRIINGIFKLWIQAIPITDLKVQYPEKVVDFCLHGLGTDPALQGTPDACSIFDVGLVLDTALRFTDHRRDEVAELCRTYLEGDAFVPLMRPDGAFSYGPDGSLRSHGGLNLAPVKDQSDATGTAIVCEAIAFLANLGGLRDELGWAPCTEWRMGLN